MPHRRNPANHKASKKASQNSPPAMAANNSDHFLPQHVCGKKSFARRECFFAHLWAEKHGSERFLFCQKGIALFDKLEAPQEKSCGALFCDRFPSRAVL